MNEGYYPDREYEGERRLVARMLELAIKDINGRSEQIRVSAERFFLKEQQQVAFFAGSVGVNPKEIIGKALRLIVERKEKEERKAREKAKAIEAATRRAANEAARIVEENED